MNVDQQLRETLRSALDIRPVPEPDALVEELTSRAESAASGSPAGASADGLGGIGAAAWAGIAAIAVGAGAIGLAIGWALSDPAEPTPGITEADGDSWAGVEAQLSASAGEAPVYLCPGADVQSTLRHGDRVWITGITADGSWVQVSSLRGDGHTVFLSSADVSPDAPLDELPEVGCETDPSPSPSPATTQSPSPQPEPEPHESATDETTQPAAPAPEPEPEPEPEPDTTAPQITSATADHSVIDNSVDYCATPAATTVRVQATDDVGVVSGAISFDAPNNPATTTALTSQGGMWVAPFGPLAPDTTVGADVPVTVTVTVRDAAGNSQTTTLTITIENCLI